MTSRQWVKFNDDSRATRNRERHIEQNGGHFERSRRSNGWQWVAPVQEEKVAPKPAKAKKAPAKKKGD